MFVAALVLLIASMGGRPSEASAGEITARFCPGASSPKFPGRFTDLGGQPWIAFTAGCHAAGNGVAGLYQDRDGESARAGQAGRIVWEAPPEVSIVEATGRVRMKDANGMRTSVLGESEGKTGRILSGADLGGSDRAFSWPTPGSAGSSIAVAISCERSGGCPNDRDSVRSFVQVDQLAITGRDRTAPAVDMSGEVVDLGAERSWADRSAGWRAMATDRGTGVHDLYLLVNGFTVKVPKILCQGLTDGLPTELAPCPGTRMQSGTLDTSSPPFREGVNDVRLCGVDYSGDAGTANRSCTARSELRVDTRAPLPPLDLETDTGPDWSARAEVSFSWSLPDDTGSPIDRSFYRLRRISTGEVVSSGEAESGSPEAADTVVPEPGEYRLEVGLVDAAGNRGSIATTPVRFDDRPAPDVMPVARADWVSRSELPLRQSVEPVEGAGPSGLAGFAVAASDLGPQTPCRASRCRLAELSWLGGPEDGPAIIDDLTEGRNTISAVAVSGAWIPSRNPGTTVVDVDITDPVVRVTGEGTDGAWSNRPVTVTAIATDALSGMKPDPADEDIPVTGVGVVGADPEVEVGATSSITVTAQGVTELEYFARDLAGNSTRRAGMGSDVRRSRTVVRIDTEAPAVRFGPVGEPRDPERVVVFTDDSASGVSDGEISIGPAGARSGFRTLATSVDSERLVASIPSDEMPPGRYVLRAEVTDLAGNRTIATSDSVIDLPIKARSSISLGTTRAGSRGQELAVSGRLSLGSESPGPVAMVEIEEVFPTGLGIPDRTRTVPVDSSGDFLVPIDPGPGRLVRASFTGDPFNGRTHSRWVRVDFRDRVAFTVQNRVTRNRLPTRMSGTVTGPGVPMPVRGKKVVIQYFDPSRRTWRPVEIVGTGPSGRFSFTYRFRTIATRQRILFRALSLGEAGWPFVPTASRPVAVVVLP